MSNKQIKTKLTELLSELKSEASILQGNIEHFDKTDMNDSLEDLALIIKSLTSNVKDIKEHHSITVSNEEFSLTLPVSIISSQVSDSSAFSGSIDVDVEVDVNLQQLNLPDTILERLEPISAMRGWVTITTSYDDSGLDLHEDSLPETVFIALQNGIREDLHSLFNKNKIWENINTSPKKTKSINSIN